VNTPFVGRLPEVEVSRRPHGAYDRAHLSAIGRAWVEDPWWSCSFCPRSTMDGTNVWVERTNPGIARDVRDYEAEEKKGKR